MPTLTIRGIPEHMMNRLRQQAAAERRSVNQQVIEILEEALPTGSPAGWEQAYESFRQKWGESLPTDDEVEYLFGGVRHSGKGRDINPFE